MSNYVLDAWTTTEQKQPQQQEKQQRQQQRRSVSSSLAENGSSKDPKVTSSSDGDFPSRLTQSDFEKLEQEELIGNAPAHSDSISSLDLKEQQESTQRKQSDVGIVFNARTSEHQDIAMFQLCKNCVENSKNIQTTDLLPCHCSFRPILTSNGAQNKFDIDWLYLKSAEMTNLSRSYSDPGLAMDTSHSNKDASVGTNTNNLQQNRHCSNDSLQSENNKTVNDHPSEPYDRMKDPLLSPILADDVILKQMPPLSIVACSLDPLFDDSVEFVKRMTSLDKQADLYVLDKLPHGFLNMQMLSGEAREGCDLLVACMKRAMHMGMREVSKTVSFT